MSDMDSATEVLGIGFEPPDRLVIVWRDTNGDERRLALPAAEAETTFRPTGSEPGNTRRTPG